MGISISLQLIFPTSQSVENSGLASAIIRASTAEVTSGGLTELLATGGVSLSIFVVPPIFCRSLAYVFPHLSPRNSPVGAVEENEKARQDASTGENINIFKS